LFIDYTGTFNSLLNSKTALLKLYKISSLLNFQQYLSYIVAVSFISGGNQSIWRKPPTCHKSLTNFIA